MNSVEEEATGLRNANSYKDYAKSRGYKHIEVLNWSSSAGDWDFFISKDGNEWRILSQTNNYPYSGFTHEIGEDSFFGTFEEVLEEVY